MAFEPRNDADEIIKRQKKLRNERSLWDTHWSESAQYCWPDGDEFITERTPGEKRNVDIFDPSATLALEKFAAAMESILTPRAQRWHRLKATNEALNDDPSVQRYFDEVNKILFAARNSPSSMFYSQKSEGYKSLGAFGNECLFVEANRSGGTRYKNVHIGQVDLALNPHREPDTIYRTHKMTAKEAWQKWGADTPPKVAKALEENPFQKFEFLHCVSPRNGYDPERMDALGMPWESHYVGVDDRVIIESGGYHEMPYMYSRYTLNPTEKFGRGPTQMVLPAIKTLQAMMRTFIESGEKVANPPLLLHDDGVMGQGTNEISLEAGYLNWGGVDARGNPLIRPLETGARLDITEGMLETYRELVNEAFLVNLFQVLVDHPNMTATEVLLRMQEKGQMLAPLVGRQQTEMLGPQIAREINILSRQGHLPEAPPVLQEAEGEYEIEYESTATRAQRTEELVGIQRTVEIALPLAEHDPTVMKVLKAPDIVRLTAEVNGVPSKLVNTEEEFEEILAEERERQQQAEAVEQAPDAADALLKASQAQAIQEKSGARPGPP